MLYLLAQFPRNFSITFNLSIALFRLELTFDSALYPALAMSPWLALIVCLWVLHLNLPLADGKCCGVVHPAEQECGDDTRAHWCCGYGDCK